MKKFNLFTSLTLILSTIMVLSLNNWMAIWIFIELNTLAFIVILKMNDKSFNHILFKYFVINAISSTIFILFISYNEYNTLSWLNHMCVLCMLIKLGFPPFHFWFIDLMNNMNWKMGLILMTIQKLIPFFLLTNLNINNYYLFLILLSGMTSMILTFNQTSLKKIMAFSSITHMAWMILILQYNYYLWVSYFIVYIILTILIFSKLEEMNLHTLMDMMKISSLWIPIMMASLSGLPPLFGFILKWMFIFNFSNYHIIFTMLLLLLISFVFLYYYMRTLVTFLMLSHFKLKIVMKFIHPEYQIIFITLMISLVGLTLIIIWFFK